MFDLLKTDSHTQARLGKLRTAHGEVDTPVFMPVGTQASVKALDPRELDEMGTQIILGNTYHLNLKPGLDIIRAAKGLHRFMNWDKPILTDSGGFQVFSLAKIRKIKPHGVEFRSHIDGSLLFLGPKEAMEIQRILGSDIAMVFDECPPHNAPAREQRHAVERTIRWARECREQPRGDGQNVFGIVQGGSNPALREECAKALVEMEFDGYAIGGVSVGEPEAEMLKAIELTVPTCPRTRPGTLWAWAHPPRCSNSSPAAWTCLIACCPRAWPATARPLRAAAPSVSKAAVTRPIFAPLTKNAIASRANVLPAPTFDICLT